MRIRGYCGSQKASASRKVWETQVYVLFLAAFEIITDFHKTLYRQHTTPRHCATSITNMVALQQFTLHVGSEMFCVS
jgi:hypothetical protein